MQHEEGIADPPDVFYPKCSTLLPREAVQIGTQIEGSVQGGSVLVRTFRCPNCSYLGGFGPLD